MVLVRVRAVDLVRSGSVVGAGVLGAGLTEAELPHYRYYHIPCQAADRAHGLLATYWGCGRGGEMKGTTYNNQSVDPHFKQLVQKLPQMKVSPPPPARPPDQLRD